MCVYCNLQKSAINRHRRKLFGDEQLKLYTLTPEDGEALAATLPVDWMGQRTDGTTDAGGKESGAWQFQVWTNDDWETSQSYLLSLAVLTVGTRRWKTGKVEKPIGRSKVLKVNAQIQ